MRKSTKNALRFAAPSEEFRTSKLTASLQLREHAGRNPSDGLSPMKPNDRGQEARFFVEAGNFEFQLFGGAVQTNIHILEVYSGIFYWKYKAANVHNYDCTTTQKMTPKICVMPNV
jgi:hypothetical protein